MIPIPDDPNPVVDALAKLYTLYETESVKFTERDEKRLIELSERIYALDKPGEHEFTSIEKQQIEKLWAKYAKE